jgi:hypothetical protein
MYQFRGSEKAQRSPSLKQLAKARVWMSYEELTSLSSKSIFPLPHGPLAVLEESIKPAGISNLQMVCVAIPSCSEL